MPKRYRRIEKGEDRNVIGANRFTMVPQARTWVGREPESVMRYSPPRDIVLRDSDYWVLTMFPKRRRVTDEKTDSRRSIRNQKAGTWSVRWRFDRDTSKLQLSTVKISYAQNLGKGAWGAHGRYISRQGAQREGEKGLGFDRVSEDRDLESTLRKWEKDGDPNLFKIIISPEKGDRINLKQHTRKLMSLVEEDLNENLQWVAIDHYNTDKPHVHIALRGVRENGKALKIDRDYISHGIRTKSRELMTEELGYRTPAEIYYSLKQMVNNRYPTVLDQSILARRNSRMEVSLVEPKKGRGSKYDRRPLLKKRLQYLESLGLVERRSGDVWKLVNDFQEQLKQFQLEIDVIKAIAEKGKAPKSMDAPVERRKIAKGETLIGRVMEAELSDEFHEPRFVLMEGADGGLHYMQASSKLRKAISSQHVGEGDVLVFEGREFKSGEKTIGYVHATRVGEWKQSAELDAQILKEHLGRQPASTALATSNGFAVEWTNAVRERKHQLAKANVLNDTTTVDSLEAYRLKEHNVEGELWKPTMKDKNSKWGLAGTISYRGLTGFQIEDVRGDNFIVSTNDLSETPMPEINEEVFLEHGGRVPGLEISNTDGRLADVVDRSGYFSPNEHAGSISYGWMDKKQREEFVGFHIIRAETWARWGVFRKEADKFIPVRPAKEIIKVMEATIEQKVKEHEENSRNRPQVTVRTVEPKRIDDRELNFSLIDRIIEHFGEEKPIVDSELGQTITRRLEFWERLRVDPGKKFRGNALRIINKVKQAQKKKERNEKESEIDRASIAGAGRKPETTIEGVLLGERKDKQGRRYALVTVGGKQRSLRTNDSGIVAGERIRATPARYAKGKSSGRVVLWALSPVEREGLVR